MNSSLAKHSRFLFRTIPVFLISYAALSVLLFSFAPEITRRLTPLYAFIIERAYPENELVSISAGGEVISYTITVHRRIKGTALPLVDDVSSSIHASFQFVTPIIYLSLLFAWPALPARRRILAFAASLPVLLLFVLTDIPVTILNSVDIACLRNMHGIPLADSFPRDAVFFLSHFFNNGGRQFFAVLLFAAVLFVLRMENKPGGACVRANASCPCGSGKLYKNCCGKKAGGLAQRGMRSWWAGTSLPLD